MSFFFSSQFHTLGQEGGWSLDHLKDAQYSLWGLLEKWSRLGAHFTAMVGKGDNTMHEVQVSASGPGLLIQAVLLCLAFSLWLEKSLRNVPFLESLRLLEMRKGKICKSKQKTEYVRANTATFYKQHFKADLFKRSHCLCEYSRGY